MASLEREAQRANTMFPEPVRSAEKQHVSRRKGSKSKIDLSTIDRMIRPSQIQRRKMVLSQTHPHRTRRRRGVAVRSP